MSKKMHESAISEKVRILGIFEITRQHHKFTDKNWMPKSFFEGNSAWSDFLQYG